MEADRSDESARTGARHKSKDQSVVGFYDKVMGCFPAPCVSDWITTPSSERHERVQKVELTRCHTKQISVPSRHVTAAPSCNREIEQNQRGLPGKKGREASKQGFAICLGNHNGTRHRLGLDKRVTAGTTCHCGYYFGNSASNGEANLNSTERRGGSAGLNLHFILIILFSTNKLTPEKT